MMIFQAVRGELGTQLFQAAMGLMMGALTNRPVRFLPMADDPATGEVHYLLGAVNPQFAVDVVALDALPIETVVLTEPAGGASVESMLNAATTFPKALLFDGQWCREGYWETLGNQAEFEAQLRLVLTPRFDDPEIAAQAREIASGAYIGIHVRRRDYGQHGLVRAAYYRNALSEIRREYGPLPVLVFTDEPQSTQAMFADIPDVAILLCNEQMPTFDLYMLSQCSHFILANSPFSFWAAMLGARPDAIVYFPGQTDTVTLGLRAGQWRVIHGAIQGL